MKAVFTQSEITHYLAGHHKDLAYWQKRKDQFNPALVSAGDNVLEGIIETIDIIEQRIWLLEELQA